MSNYPPYRTYFIEEKKALPRITLNTSSFIYERCAWIKDINGNWIYENDLVRKRFVSQKVWWKGKIVKNWSRTVEKVVKYDVNKCSFNITSARCDGEVLWHMYENVYIPINDPENPITLENSKKND